MKVRCDKCYGKGFIKCNVCEGEGKISKVKRFWRSFIRYPKITLIVIIIILLLIVFKFIK